MITGDPIFWVTKSLHEMTTREWESLCDGCGRCCLHKLEDVETGTCYYTDVACHLLDMQSCRCSRYAERQHLIPDCLDLFLNREKQYAWLPASCAYRRLFEGRPLAWWHPLVSGNPETVHTAGISVRGRIVNEYEVDPERYADHIIFWVKF